MKITVFACPRTRLAGRPLPPDVHLVDVPCAGRVSTTLLLATLARGADGIIVLGRQQQTCRFNGAEDPARERCEAVDAVLGLSCLGSRVLFCDSGPGPRGARRAVEQQLAALATIDPLGLETSPPPSLLAGEGLETALAIWRWLNEQTGGEIVLGQWLAATCLPATGEHTLAIGELPVLSLLGGELWRPLGIPELTAQALDLLEHFGVDSVGVAPAPRGASYAFGPTPGAMSLAALIADRATALPAPPTPAGVACDGTALQMALLETLGYRPIDVGPDPLPDRFNLTPDDRANADGRLRRAEAAGAVALLATNTGALLRWALLTRHGVWRTTRVRPLLPHQLAWLSLEALPLTFQTVDKPWPGTPPRSEALP